MKDKWRLKYQESISLLDHDRINVLTGFNANIDVLYDFEDLKIDLTSVEPELKNPVENEEDLKSCLKFCIENGANKEVNRRNYSENLSTNGVERLGGQGGIMANFLSGLGDYTTFYTPLLSEEIAEKLNEDVVYPSIEGKIILKRVKECVNTDRTKYNTIIEFNENETGRLILSGQVKGFGPYFRKGIEENSSSLDDNLDRIILSGFQNIEGNFETKLNKTEKQMNKFETPKHLEYVSMEEDKARKVLEDLLSSFDSIGMDEEEAKDIAEMLKIDISDDVSLGDAYQVGKELVKNKEVSRCHIHSYKYNLVVVDEDYEISMDKIQESVLFGVSSAIQMAEIGELPTREDVQEFNLKNKHIHRLDELEDFGHHLDLENFAETGKAEIEGVKVVAVPSLIHQNPKRLVGMGDIISSGAFTAEIR